MLGHIVLQECNFFVEIAPGWHAVFWRKVIYTNCLEGCSMKKRALLSAAVAAGLSGLALAGPIGINFVDTGDGFVQNGTGDALAPTEAAGAPGYVQFGWNNMGR